MIRYDRRLSALNWCPRGINDVPFRDHHQHLNTWSGSADTYLSYHFSYYVSMMISSHATHAVPLPNYQLLGIFESQKSTIHYENGSIAADCNEKY